jgi:DedD protein
LRDVGKVKDRFEFKLDSNRVFFLFAGLAAYSALLFVLGIVVGRSARPEPAGTLASAPVLLPDERPTPQRIEDRLGDAQPKATEEPEIPLKAIWELDKPSKDNSLTGAITATKTPPAESPKPAATPKASDVAVAPTPVPEKTAAPVDAGAAKAAFTLQVIAYNDLDQAKALEASLKKRGFDAYTVTAQVAGKTVHRVRVGKYASRAVAETAAPKLAAAEPGTKPMVVAFTE